MKLLLTSAGIRNASLHAALMDLLGKPIAECRALCIPTALHGHPYGSPEKSWNFVAGQEPRNPMSGLGWKSVGLLELTALSSIPAAHWQSWVRQADVLLVNGGDALYLAHWMRESGLAAFLETLPDMVWVGLSAGSMAMAPRVGDDFIAMKPPLTGEDRALGVVGFSIFPHLDNPECPENTLPAARQWAAGLGCPGYAIDDETGIRVVDGRVDVISEGHWEFLPA